MNLWEYIGNTQGTFKNTPAGKTPVSRNGRIPFSTSFDIASNLPANPGGWMDATNNTLESARKWGTTTVGQANPALVGGTIGLLTGGIPGAAIGVGAGLTIQGVDSITDGGATKVLQASQKNLRSNYAFVRDVTDKNVGMGLLASLTMIAGGALGGVAGFAVGGPVGAFAGATLGANLAGFGEREALKSDLGAKISGTLNKSAKFAQTDVGHEQYNIGRDFVQTAAKITTWNTLGDTTKGIGAITSGLVNFGVEATMGGDIAAGKAIGVTAKRTLVRPIVEPMTGLQRKVFGPTEAARVGQRLAADVDMIKRTVAGEETPYTPVFKFYRENDLATVSARKEFDSADGKVAAALVAGETDERIALVIRAGRYDTDALAELAAQHADKFAELTRLDDAMAYVEQGGLFSMKLNGQTLVLSKRFKNNVELLNAEIDSLKKQVSWLDDALSIKGKLTDRTVSKWAMIERIRNDFAKENSAKGLAVKNALPMETGLGKTYQWFYQKSPLSRPIRGIDRISDDAPRQVIPFNDALQASIRMQTSLRSAEKYGASIPQENIRLNNNWLNARTEAEKLNVIEDYVGTGMKLLALKHGVSVPVIEEAIKKYNQTHRRMRDEAVTARELKQGYMNDPNDLEGPLIADAQLITQLANGAIIPDWKFVDGVLEDFVKRNGNVTKIDMTKDNVKYLADELNSLWRTGTLLRSGYPVNVIKDSYIRAWGDMALFDMFKYVGQDFIDDIAKSGNSVRKVQAWSRGKVDPAYNMKKLRNEINGSQSILNVYDKTLKDAGIDPVNPPKKITVDMQRHVDLYNNLATRIAVLRKQEEKLVSGIQEKRVSRPTLEVEGETFESAFAGRFGALFEHKISQKDDLRAAVAGVRELHVDTARRGRSGAATVLPVDETKHLQSWVQILNDKLRFDPVARMIMEGKSKKDVVKWLRSGDAEAFAYLDRFSDNLRDAADVYERVKVPVDMYAPSKALRDTILKDELDLVSLKKLYPDLNQRPPVYGDLVDDMLAVSPMTKQARQKAKDMVVWLSTVPTARLAFSPYFRVKYEQSLQSQIYLANANGLKLTSKMKNEFEQNARVFAEREYKEKLNSFHRDMNYSGFINYILAFFPAVIEQFRAYGRITMENPDFIVKKTMISTIPERMGEVQEDVNGNRFVPIKLGFLGLESRLPVEWFNPDNPTGGNILSVSPFGAALVNEYAKRNNVENWFTDKILPFGVQSNSLNALTPNTGRRLYQLWQAKNKTGEQFNKDVDMFNKQLMLEYVQQNGKRPSASQVDKIFGEAQNRAFFLSVLRAVSAATLPVQGRLVTSVTGYVDLLNKYDDKYGAEGSEMFSQDFPDAWMFMDRLSDSTSGINADKTAAALVKGNMGSVRKIIGGIGQDNLTVLGAIFNDDDYAFSSAAQAFLQDTKIPGAGNKKFRDVSDAFENMRSSIVSKGWKDYFALEQIVKDEFSKASPPINAYGGYGQEILKQFKNAYVESQKVQNNLWWNEYNQQSYGGAGSRQADTVAALTIALNDDKLWSQLAKQPKYHMIADYLSYRYTVKDRLDQMGTTIDSKKATWLRNEVSRTVGQMRMADVNFDKFYTRYFENDKFDFVYEEPGVTSGR